MREIRRSCSKGREVAEARRIPPLGALPGTFCERTNSSSLMFLVVKSADHINSSRRYFGVRPLNRSTPGSRSAARRKPAEKNSPPPKSKPGQRFPDARQNETGFRSNFEKIVASGKYVRSAQQSSDCGNETRNCLVPLSQVFQITGVESFLFSSSFRSKSPNGQRAFLVDNGKPDIARRMIEGFATANAQSHPTLRKRRLIESLPPFPPELL